MSDITLYGYWRSSAAYRVRIALNLKGVGYRDHPVHLIQDGGQQHRPEYHALNPLDVVPTLIHGRDVLTQSMAIIEYIDEIYPDPPLLPVDALGRARVRALAQVIGCDVHPVANLRVLQYLEKQFGDKADKAEWSRHWIVAGLAAFEQLVAGDRRTGRFCHGDTPGIADLVLVPQLYNAVRWGVPLGDYPTLLRIKAACDELEAFARAVPEVQRDAPSIAS
ncbi:maleylacetoacetate isomerase [Dyella sp.]|uniref:maleylacetoacetate isomerase n=1 Tax=Dyella sp. TaxID=1869338 RepID=UPI002ED348A0